MVSVRIGVTWAHTTSPGFDLHKQSDRHMRVRPDAKSRFTSLLNILPVPRHQSNLEHWREAKLETTRLKKKTALLHPVAGKSCVTQSRSTV